MVNSPHGRGTCPVCRRDYNLTGAGAMPRHWARDARGQVPAGLPTCDGWKKKPA